jgi:hypothetical protein
MPAQAGIHGGKNTLVSHTLPWGPAFAGTTADGYAPGLPPVLLPILAQKLPDLGILLALVKQE